MSVVTLLLLLVLEAGPVAPAPSPGPPAPLTESTDEEQTASPPNAAEEPRYPLRLSEPDFVARGEPFKLVDLRYGFSDTFSTTQAFAARVRVQGWGYLGAEVEGERRSLALMVDRLVLAAEATDGVYDLFGRYRARRFLLSANAHRLSPAEGGDWLLSPGVSLRLSREFELLGEMTGDTSRPQGRFLRSASAGFLWEHGARLEVEGGYGHARETTEEGSENVRDTATVRFVAQVGRVEFSGHASLDDVEGRFPRRQEEVALSARLLVTSRLLLEGAGQARFERDASDRSHGYRAAVTWFARRFYLPRSGPAAERTLALAYRATEMGYNERPVFDDDQRREQRERLSLTPRRDELLEDMRELYRAQVEERAVPTLGLEFLESDDELSGFKSQTLRASLGVPWPPAWPWRHDESATPFLRLDLERERRLSGLDYEAIRYGVALTTSLNREMDLVLRWSRAEPTPLELIRGIGPYRTIELSYVYAFGR